MQVWKCGGTPYEMTAKRVEELGIFVTVSQIVNLRHTLLVEGCGQS
jgi:hypothetical protein